MNIKNMISLILGCFICLNSLMAVERDEAVKSKFCCVCIAKIDSDGSDARPIVRTQCGHYYHQECLIDSFVGMSASQKKCPCCAFPFGTITHDPDNNTYAEDADGNSTIEAIIAGSQRCRIVPLAELATMHGELPGHFPDAADSLDDVVYTEWTRIMPEDAEKGQQFRNIAGSESVHRHEVKEFLFGRQRDVLGEQ